MAELNQEMLFAACRAIFEMAGENFVLPPLLRDAESLQTQPSYEYTYPVGKAELHFFVALDEAYADRNALPDSKIPLQFHVELRDGESRNHAVELSGYERHELIRAFLLGVRAPIFAEKINEESAYKLSIQLSATFFVDCGELNDEYSDCSFAVICDHVGQKLYERSTDFFDDRQQGLAVWSLRAAQGLFGEARPAAEEFWPYPLDETVAIVSPVAANANERVKPRHSRYATAATLLLGLLGSGILAATFVLSGETVTPPETAASSTDVELAVLPSERTTVASTEAKDTDAFFDAPQNTTLPLGVVAEQQTDATRPQEPPAPIVAGAPEDRGQHRRAAKRAKIKRPQPSNPLEFTRNAVASLTGVVKGLERIPGAIFNANKRLKI